MLTQTNVLITLVIVMNVEQSEVTVEAVDFAVCFAD